MTVVIEEKIMAPRDAMALASLAFLAQLMTSTDALLDWRGYWDLHFPNVEPPEPMRMLASPLSVDMDTITRSFICISQINHNLCLCTQIDLNVCAHSNISGGPAASTCVYQFFYEYEKSCKGQRIPMLQDDASRGSQMLNDRQQTMQLIDDSTLKENDTTSSLFSKQQALYKPIIKSFFHPDQLVSGDTISFPSLSNNLPKSQGFLPRSLANMLPFDSNNLTRLLSILNIPINSSMADNIVGTLEFCGQPYMGGDTMQCVTSIEAMVDFAVKTLGKNAMVLTPNVESLGLDDDLNKLQVTIDKVLNITTGLDHGTTTCHNLVYPYLVYGCHATTSASVLSVTFKGIQGHGLVVCHHDTSTWNSNHPAFSELQTHPNDRKVICHWIPHNHYVWMPSV